MQLSRFIRSPPIPSQRAPSKEHNTNPISILFFGWSFRLIRTAVVRRLELNDFPLLNPNRTSEAMSSRLRRQLDIAFKCGRHRPLIRACVIACRFNVCLASILDFSSIILDYANIITFYFFFQYLKSSREDVNPPSFGKGVIWITVICAVQGIGTMCEAHAHYRAQMLGAELKSATICLISQKSMTIDPDAAISSRKDDSAAVKWSPGATMTLINVHAERFSELFLSVIGLSKNLLSFPLVFALLCWLLGWPAVPAMVGSTIVFAIGSYCAFRALRSRHDANKRTDERVAQFEGLLKGVRLIKLFGWEEYFYNLITATRHKEISTTCRLTLWTALQAGITNCAISHGPIVGYAIYASRNDLAGNPRLVLAGIAYLTFDRYIWRLVVFTFLIINALPAAERIESYLKANDLSIDDNPPESSVALHLDSAYFTWPTDADNPSHHAETDEKVKLQNDADQKHNFQIKINQEDEFVLHALNLTIKSNELVAIVGPSQAGKSSLLSAIIGDMPRLKGQMSIQGLPAYCPQEAWIQSTTVKANVLFGQPFQAELYNKVVDACALRRDFETFPRGDLSELGERGINLSGGQKHRLHLARTIYQAITDDRQLVLLDDPLSAVDANTASVLFATIRGMLQGKCRILVTHQLQFLSRVDRIIYLENGRIVADGTFSQLQQNPSFVSFLGDYEQLAVKPTAREPSTSVLTPEPESDKVFEEEERAAYRVEWKLYRRVIGSKPWIFFGANFVMVVSQVGFVLFNLSIVWWTTSRFNLSLAQYIGLTVTFAATNQMCWTLNNYLIQTYLLKESDKKSCEALKGVLNAPMSFYIANPAGRLINRLTADLSTLDTVFPHALFCLVLCFVFSTAYLAIILSYVPLVTTLLIPWFASGLLVFAIYKAMPLETKRLSVNLGSNYLSLLHESLAGRSTIVLAKQQSSFQQTLFDRIDEFNSVAFLSFAASEWANIAHCMGFVIIMYAGGFLLLLKRFTNTPAIGILVYAIFQTVSAVMLNVLEFSSICQKSINAVERLAYYAEDLPFEGERYSDEMKEGWPSSGSIRLDKVCLRYKPDLPMALQDLSMDIRDGEKIGIVGRTGAGKSTLLMALLRLVELAEGTVYIDGVDISRLGLHDVRHAIATIPQDPILFAESVRFNLDPQGRISDDRLMEALGQVRLVGESAENGGLTLDTWVKAGGANFSSGQKQLLSLARALAKGSKVIVIDEATSNVDLAKDHLVQATIRQVFADCTVLTIAHRLRTVLQNDRICVMDRGRVAEMAPPKELFENESSLFRKLCDQAGVTIKDF